MPRLRLRDDRTLLHDEGACLPLRSLHGQCRACASACPTAAIDVSLDAVTLAAGCIGCGRCIAACPTQALMLPELVGWPAPAGAAASISAAPAPPRRVECRKVPADLHAADTVVLPCIGALTTGQLLARAAAGEAIDVVDRGWCQGCTACSTTGAAEDAPHPARAALESATLWLQALGIEAAPFRLVHDPLPLSLRPEAIPPLPEPGPTLDRRRFFRAALERPAGRERAAAPMGGDGRAAHPADQRQPSPERERQHGALQQLARQRATTVPAEFYPALHADADCCDARMCVALCPTAALTVSDDGASAHLAFTAERCIACGTCERACPEGALHLAPHGGHAGPQVLASHLRQRCPSCGDAFTAQGEAHAGDAPALCPTCTKSRRFMDDARRQLFGALN